MFRRIRPHCAFALAVSVVLAAPAEAAEADAPSKPFSKITLNLNSGGIEETLPFDIPFYFTGTVDENVKRFDVAVVERADRDASPGCTGGREIAKPMWQHREGASLDFMILQPRPLRANRNYCLSVTIVRAVGTTKVTAFKQEAATRINLFLRTIPRERGATINEVQTLRDQLRAIVADPNTGDRLIALPGSIFVDTTGLPADQQTAIYVRFRGFLAGIKTAQDNKYNDIETLQNTQIPRAIASFSLWGGGNTFYLQLLDKLDEVAKTNAALNSLLTPHRQVLRDLTTLSGAALARAIDGTQVEGTHVRLEDVWEAREIEDRVGRVRTTLAHVTEALNFMTSVQNPPANTSYGLTAAEGVQLATLVTQIATTKNLLDLGVIATFDDLEKQLDRRQQEITRVVNDLGEDLQQNVTLVATTVGNFATRHAWYIGADLGFAWIPTIEETSPYIGTNIYFRPVNKNAPLRGETDSFGRRASLMVGITVSDISKGGQRENLFSGRMVLAGGGLRVNDSLRVAGGTLLFKAPDPNPFIDRTRIKFAFFASVSVDWDVRGTFTEMGTKTP